MSGFSLTPRSVARLAAIFEWTIERFGLPRAEAYRRDLLRRCAALDRIRIDRIADGDSNQPRSALAGGSPPHGRPCGALLGEQADPADLYFYREGGHYIIYRKTEGRLIVIDFVHGARDLEGLLKDLVR